MTEIDELFRLKIDCVIQVMGFETCLAYYSQSDGEFYEQECRMMAGQLVEAYRALTTKDHEFSNKLRKSLGIDAHALTLIHNIQNFATGGDIYEPGANIVSSRYHIFRLISQIKSVILREIKVGRLPAIAYYRKEHSYSVSAKRWESHFSRAVHSSGYGHHDELISTASKTRSIVVVGDIRRSQDLMTYAKNSSDFSSRMAEFVLEARKIIDHHQGLFDKFTGDGFIAYFNESICEFFYGDQSRFIQDFLLFLREINAFATPFFAEWASQIRKHPDCEIGLAIGADIGIVEFNNINNHLVAVGDAIVWANRMSSIAKANEVVINNLLHSELRDDDSLTFIPRTAETKTGERFTAYALSQKASEPTTIN